MAEGISIRHKGKTTMLKWHRGRRAGSDAVFTGKRIIEGMQLGASVEVDLERHGSGGFAILHDETLDRETSGTGRVVDHNATALRQLFLRDNEGNILTEPLMLLEDLSALLKNIEIAPDAVLQLDLKNSAKDLGPDDVAAFADAVAPWTANMLLSSGDAAAVEMLSAAVPDLRIGYDPCHDETLAVLLNTQNFEGFVAAALAAAPKAEMIYLYYLLVDAADKAGHNIIKPFQDAGKRVDAWTIRTINAETRPIVDRLLALGVDQITTDDPIGFEKALAASA